VPTWVSSQNNIYVKNLNIEDGLSQTYVNCIFQDKFGFIWIGTQDGLNKYDGRSFYIYRYQPRDPYSISNSNIQSISQDSLGNLWIATPEGLNYFDRYSGHFTEKVLFPESNKETTEIFSVFVASDGIVWCKTADLIISILPKTGEIIKYPYERPNDFVPSNQTASIFEDSEHTMWFGTNDGLYCFEKGKSLIEFHHRPDDPFSLSSNEVHTITEDANRKIIIGTANGISIYDKRINKFERYLFSEKKHEQNSIFAILQSKSKLWVATNDKIGSLNLKENKLIQYSHLSQIKRISGGLVDFSGLLWISTYNGVYKIDVENQKFNHYFDSDFTAANNTSSQIRSFYIDKNNLIWVGTKDAGLQIYNRETNKIERTYNTTSPNSKIISNAVEVIFEDSRSDIWIGTGSGLMKYNQKTKQFVNSTQFLTEKKFDLENKWISAICEDKNGSLWLGTRGNGVYKLTGQKLVNYCNSPSNLASLSSDIVYCLLQDKEGSIWVGTSNGLNRITPSSGKIKIFRKKRNVTNGLSNNLIITLCQTSDSILWVGTEAGLNKLNIHTGNIEIFTQNRGTLKNDFIYEIVYDNKDFLWMSTNRGIIKFNILKKNSTYFDLSDGIQNYEYNIGAKYVSKDGEIFFGGINGFNSFYPWKVKPNRDAPKIVMSTIQYRNKDNEKITKNIEALKEVTFEYSDYDFKINFAMLEYTNPEEISYMYKLNPIYGRWKSLENRNYIEFSSLNSGDYELQIQGANSDFILSNEITILKIRVKSPYWQTTFAYIMYFILICFSIFIFVRFLTRKLRNTRYELNERQKTNTEISKQKEELTLAHKNLTDSINYANRIITAMMPNEKVMKQHLPHSFVLSMPKDIVSGDFYWITEREDLIFLAVVDCTGHGVPGAFMSIIGFDLLRNIVEDMGVNDPSEIMQMLDSGVARTFGKQEEDSVRDGMDMVFVVIDKANKSLEYCGAFNPFLMIRDNNIMTIDGDRCSVGATPEENFRFEKHHVDLKKDDIIYLFSDGYTDQFGGSEGKKFKRRRFRYLLLNIHKEPVEKQAKMLENAIMEWKGDREQVDDIIIVGFKPLG